MVRERAKLVPSRGVWGHAPPGNFAMPFADIWRHTLFLTSCQTKNNACLKMVPKCCFLLWIYIKQESWKFSLLSLTDLYLFSGIYRPPWYSLADDTRLEKNIEQAYLLNKELILLGDWNINALDRLKFKKHHLSKGLLAMNLNQLVLEITRPMSGTCLEHIYSNHSHRIHNIVCPVVGLADHLPLFCGEKI